jgi:hypothetical protein
MQIAHLHMCRAALHVTVRYMSRERYVSRRVTRHCAALVHGRAVHHVGHSKKNGCRATRTKISREPYSEPCGAPVHRSANAPRAPPQGNEWRGLGLSADPNS